MENPLDLPEERPQYQVNADGAITHASSANPTTSNISPDDFHSQDETGQGDLPVCDASSDCTSLREDCRQLPIRIDRSTHFSGRNASVQVHPLAYDKSSDSEFLHEQRRQPSLVGEKATTSAVRDRSSHDDAFNQKVFRGNDPLLDDEKLLWGPRLAQPGDDSENIIQKSPSDQGPLKFRWGGTVRTTGRAKTGLLITVPGPQTSISLVKGGPITGNSIMYAYASSSSSSGRTTNSFGAVGDHLLSTRSNRWSLNPLPSVQEDPSVGARGSQAHQTNGRALASAGANDRSPLANLAHDSTPDNCFPLIAIGETGPLQRPVSVQIVAPSSLRTQRRRSLSDLIQSRSLQSSPTRQGMSDAVRSFRLAADPPQEAPVWHRAGPPFFPKAPGVGQKDSLNEYLDPESFSLPYGSKVYIMKAKNLINLRASVRIGVWSSPLGVSRVFQGEWERKGGNERIIFLFSIIKGHKHNGKYCGMAEMSGPYNPDFNPQIWTQDMQENEGSIPLRWLVAKEVAFSVFDGQKQNETPVTMMRHGNIVVGEAGRQLVQTYFEHAHGNSAIIHPDIENGQPTRNAFSQRFSRGREWIEGQSGHGREPRSRRQMNSATQIYPSNFGYTSTINRPHFQNPEERHQPQFENLQLYNQPRSMHTLSGRAPQSQHVRRLDPDLVSPAGKAWPGHGSQYGYDSKANSLSGPPPMQAPTLNQPPPDPARHGHGSLIQDARTHYVPPNMQAPSVHGSRYDYAPRPNTYNSPHSRHILCQYGYDGSSSMRAQEPSRNIRPLQASSFGTPPQVAPIHASRDTLQSWDDRNGSAHCTHVPPAFAQAFGQAAPLYRSGLGQVTQATQFPAFGPRFEQGAPSNESGFSQVGHPIQSPVVPFLEPASTNESRFEPLTPTNARARFGSNFDPLRAPRYHPLGYAAPIRGSHFGRGRSPTSTQEAPQLPIPEFDGSGKPNASSTQGSSYDWET